MFWRLTRLVTSTSVEARHKVTGRDDYVEWFTDVLASFRGLTTAAIVGNSYGGWLGANFALLRPDLVSSLVLISPPLVFTKYKAAFWAHLFSAAFVRSEKSAKRFARWFVSDPTFDDPAARSWLNSSRSVCRSSPA